MEIFPTLAALQIYQKNGRAHFEDNVSKNVSKNHAKNRTTNEKIRGLEGVLGGLGAFLELCRAGLAAEAQKCTPEVPKLVQFGRILEVKLGLKSQKKSIENLLNFWLFFELLLETKIPPKSHQNGDQNRFQDAFQGAWKRKW